MSESRTCLKTDKCQAFTQAKGIICHSHKFSEEFELISLIGEGGFAKVYKVRSLTDHKNYAIKKISINLNKSTRKIKEDIESVVNEVRLMSMFDDKLIVKMNHAWVEITEKHSKEKKKKIEQCFQQEWDLNQESSYIYDEEVDYFTRKNYFEERKIFEASEDSSEEDCQYRFIKSKSEEEIEIGGIFFKLSHVKKLIFYIQLELCDETLNDKIKKRNEKEIPSKENKISEEDLFNSLKLFRKIVKSVNILHSQGLIHRDLKPENILFSGESPKLSDFGLTTEVLNVKYKKFSIDTVETRKTSADSSYDHSCHLSYHTKNVGTLQYAAPEQINKNFYDQKADIFSLGIIFFEMIYPITTGMERHNLLKNLKEKNFLPDNLTNKFPYISEFILKMTHSEPEKRPDCKSLIFNIDEIISKKNPRVCNSKSVKIPKYILKKSRPGESSRNLIKKEKENLIKLNKESQKLQCKLKSNEINQSNKDVDSKVNLKLKKSSFKKSIGMGIQTNNRIDEFNQSSNFSHINVEKGSMKLVNEKIVILPHKNSKSSMIFSIMDCDLNVKNSEIIITQPKNQFIVKAPSKKLLEIKELISPELC